VVGWPIPNDMEGATPPATIPDEIAIGDFRLHVHGVEAKRRAIAKSIIDVGRFAQFAVRAADHCAASEIGQLRRLADLIDHAARRASAEECRGGAFSTPRSTRD
jgi:hypothetical protein